MDAKKKRAGWKKTTGGKRKHRRLKKLAPVSDSDSSDNSSKSGSSASNGGDLATDTIVAMPGLLFQTPPRRRISTGASASASASASGSAGASSGAGVAKSRHMSVSGDELDDEWVVRQQQKKRKQKEKKDEGNNTDLGLSTQAVHTPQKPTRRERSGSPRQRRSRSPMADESAPESNDSAYEDSKMARKLPKATRRLFPLMSGVVSSPDDKKDFGEWLQANPCTHAAKTAEHLDQAVSDADDDENEDDEDAEDAEDAEDDGDAEDDSSSREADDDGDYTEDLLGNRVHFMRAFSTSGEALGFTTAAADTAEFPLVKTKQLHAMFIRLAKTMRAATSDGVVSDGEVWAHSVATILGRHYKVADGSRWEGTEGLEHLYKNGSLPRYKVMGRVTAATAAVPSSAHTGLCVEDSALVTDTEAVRERQGQGRAAGPSRENLDEEARLFFGASDADNDDDDDGPADSEEDDGPVDSDDDNMYTNVDMDAVAQAYASRARVTGVTMKTVLTENEIATIVDAAQVAEATAFTMFTMDNPGSEPSLVRDLTVEYNRYTYENTAANKKMLVEAMHKTLLDAARQSAANNVTAIFPANFNNRHRPPVQDGGLGGVGSNGADARMPRGRRQPSHLAGPPAAVVGSFVLASTLGQADPRGRGAPPAAAARTGAATEGVYQPPPNQIRITDFIKESGIEGNLRAVFNRDFAAMDNAMKTLKFGIGSHMSRVDAAKPAGNRRARDPRGWCVYTTADQDEMMRGARSALADTNNNLSAAMPVAATYT